MIRYQAIVISNSMIAFSTFLGVLSAWVYYAYQILETKRLFGMITLVNIYILLNLLFLYILKRGRIIK